MRRLPSLEKQPWWKQRRVVVPAVVALLVAAPLLTLDLELFFLNLFGLSIGALLLRRFIAPASSDTEVPALTERASGSLVTHIPNTQGVVSIRGRPLSLYPQDGLDSARQHNKQKHLGGA